MPIPYDNIELGVGVTVIFFVFSPRVALKGFEFRSELLFMFTKKSGSKQNPESSLFTFCMFAFFLLSRPSGNYASLMSSI